MELKMKYSYSYFIYPYIIKEINYKRYIQRLLKNGKCIPKLFGIEKNLSIYNYFLPTVREYMFKSFRFSKTADSPNSTLDDKLRESLFKSSPCSIFDYDIGKEAQAKAGEEDGIFFRIENIEIICFETGICFLAIKTNIEDTNKFSDLLNFNVKFRDVNSESTGLEAYRNIKIQSSTFGDIKRLSEIIREITGSVQEPRKIDIDTNRFLIYSYVCLDQEYWNENKHFSEIEKEYFKFANVLNSEYNSNYNNERLQTVSLGNYIKIGISKAGVNLLTTSINTVNYTNLPFEFENEYFYTYIFSLYEKFYFSKLLNDFKTPIKQIKAAKKFVEFTNDLWVHEITNSDNGSLIFKASKEALDLKAIYETAKEQYDVAYKSLKIKNSDMLNKIILVLLAISIVTNIVNFINLYKLK